MQTLRSLLGWQIANELPGAKFAQVTCYLSTLGFFAIAMCGDVAGAAGEG